MPCDFDTSNDARCAQLPRREAGCPVFAAGRTNNEQAATMTIRPGEASSAAGLGADGKPLA